MTDGLATVQSYDGATKVTHDLVPKVSHSHVATFWPLGC